MEIYHYHPETGEFLAIGEADESPLEPGVFLIPAHATNIQPPQAAYGTWAFFVGGEWIIKVVAEPPVEPPPTPPTLEDLRLAKYAELSADFDNALANGEVTTSLGFTMNCRRSATKNDLQNMETLLSSMQRKGLATTAVKDATGEMRTVTQANLQQIIAEMEDYGLALYQRKFSLEAQAKAATTEAELKVIVW